MGTSSQFVDAAIRFNSALPTVLCINHTDENDSVTCKDQMQGSYGTCTDKQTLAVTTVGVQLKSCVELKSCSHL